MEIYNKINSDKQMRQDTIIRVPKSLDGMRIIRLWDGHQVTVCLPVGLGAALEKAGITKEHTSGMLLSLPRPPKKGSKGFCYTELVDELKPQKSPKTDKNVTLTASFTIVDKMRSYNGQNCREIATKDEVAVDMKGYAATETLNMTTTLFACLNAGIFDPFGFGRNMIFLTPEHGTEKQKRSVEQFIHAQRRGFVVNLDSSLDGNNVMQIRLIKVRNSKHSSATFKVPKGYLKIKAEPVNLGTSLFGAFVAIGVSELFDKTDTYRLDVPSGQESTKEISCSGNPSRPCSAANAEFRSCYEKLLQRKPTAVGRINVSFEVLSSGRVSKNIDILSESKELDDTELLGCIARVIERMRFPGKKGQRKKMKLPLIFKPL